MTALDRWLHRCWNAAFFGTGVPSGRGRRPRDIRRGIDRARRLGKACCLMSPLAVLQLIAEELGRVEATTDGRRDHLHQGLRLASGWLREEIEAEEARTRRALLLLTDDFCEFCVIGSTWHYHAPDCPIGQALGHLSAADSDRVEQEREAALREIPKPRSSKGGAS